MASCHLRVRRGLESNSVLASILFYFIVGEGREMRHAL